MNKALLLSSLLFAAAGCAAETHGVATEQTEALAARASLVDAVFLSTETFAAPYGTTRLKLTFVRAENYSFDGTYHDTDQRALEYEIVAQSVVEATGEVINHDRTFFARKSADGTFDFFDCDSSRNCSTTYGETKMTMSSGDEGRALDIKNANIYLIGTAETDLTFAEVPR